MAIKQSAQMLLLAAAVTQPALKEGEQYLGSNIIRLQQNGDKNASTLWSKKKVLQRPLLDVITFYHR